MKTSRHHGLTTSAAERLRAIRLAAGMTLENVAEAAGTTNQMIGMLERGERKITLQWLDRLAKAFNVSAADIVAPSDRDQTEVEAPDAQGQPPSLVMPTEEQKPLSDRIREARLARGWSQAELAERANAKQQTVNLIEHGQSLNSRYLRSICSALGIAVEEGEKTLVEAVPLSELAALLASLREQGLTARARPSIKRGHYDVEIT